MNAEPRKSLYLGLANALLLTLALPASASTPTEIAKLLASDASGGDAFGLVVAVAGNTAVIGAPSDADAGSSSGSAYVFTRSGTTWTEQAKLTASDAAAGDEFGSDVAINDDTIVIGALSDSDAGRSSGSVYVFTRSGTTWTEQGKLTASDAAAGDQFGWSVDVIGNTAVIGAPDDDSGSVYVFTRTGTTWAEQAKLTASDGDAGDAFGLSLAITGETLLVGAPFDINAGVDNGSVYVFTLTGAAWIEQAKLMASDAAAGDRFGYDIAVTGDTAVIGAVTDDDAGEDSGSAYVFTRSGATWTEQAKLTASDASTGDLFGFSVAINSNMVVIGADLDDEAGSDSGAAYVFMRIGTMWVEQAKLMASDAEVGDRFGNSVAAVENTILVGADHTDDAGTASGSVYVFSLGSDIAVDILPGSDRNKINVRAKGKIPVAILTTKTFDALQVDWETVRFGPDGGTEAHGRSHISDVDGDGDMDLLLHFKTRETGIQCGDRTATLTGETFAGEVVVATGSIRTVGCN